MFINCKQVPPKLDGILLDNNKKPIPNGKIYCKIWKKALHSEEVSSDFFTSTDNNGKFFIDLKDAEHLDFVIECTGFYPFVKKGYIPNFRNSIEVLLNKEEGSFSAISSFDKENKKLKIGIEQEVSISGIKSISIKDTILDSPIIVWLESENDNLKKLFICTTNSSGIFPIYDKEINGSIYWELIYAPIDGYKKKHTINGNEVGYFIKTEKGYAKLILDNDISSGTRPHNDGYIKFKYYSFDWIYNAYSNDLSVSSAISNKMLE